MYRFLPLLLLLNQAFAQEVLITEIQPFSTERESEWFEFLVSGEEEVHMAGWKLSNGAGNPKKFLDHAEKLLFSESAELIENLNFKLSSLPTFFSWNKSPLSLPDGGGKIQILDENDEILAEANYPKGRSGKNSEGEWSEIWNLGKNGFVPMIFKASKNNHTKLKPNQSIPTQEQDYKIFFTEASPKNTQADFIEILVVSGLEKINLKYVSMKHNGTTLWRFENDFWIKPEEKILIYFDENIYGITKNTPPYKIHTNKKSGLSSGSGTLEILTMSGTSFEKTVNFWCWKNESLSKTEQKRLDKNKLSQHWEGECYEVKNLIENESIGLKNEAQKAKNLNGLFRHFNGSPGKENKTLNNDPLPVIEVQGSKKIHGTIPFNLNLTGENSTDPDGKKDLKSFEWQINNKIFSTKPNPENLKIETEGKHLIKLILTDQSGAKNTKTLEVTTYAKGSSSGKSRTQNIIKELILKQENSDEENPENILVKKILENYKPEILIPYPPYEKEKKEILKIKNTFKNYPPLTKKAERIVPIPEAVRTRMRKNLGILFTWRESPWPDLAVESTFDEASDQKFARFEAGYLGASPAPYRKPLIAETRFSGSREAQ